MDAFHSDVAAAIGQQVEQMILHAKADSETRVRQQLAITKSQLLHVEHAVNQLRERAASQSLGLAGQQLQSQHSLLGGGNLADGTFLYARMAALEQKWQTEVKALKQDLHRTILAHNHNSDLMRHHRDALDEVRRKLEMQSAKPRVEQIDGQIEKVDMMLRAGLAKHRALDTFALRLQQMEEEVNQVFILLPAT